MRRAASAEIAIAGREGGNRGMSTNLSMPLRDRARLTRRAILVSVSIAGALLAASSVQIAAAQTAAVKSVVDDKFDLNALIDAARKEGSVTVLSTSGDVLKVGENFEKKYGIKVNASKSNDNQSIEKITREASSGNFTIDLALFEDGPSVAALLLPQKIVYSWLPKDLLNDIPEPDRNPVNFIVKQQLFAYNPRLFPNGCPVQNLWDLTTPEWRGKVTMQDPLTSPARIWWFNDLALNGASKLAEAYKKKFGKELKTDKKNAAYAWIDALAQNAPILGATGEDSAAAVGAPNQAAQRIGMFSNATFRDIVTQKYDLKVCTGLMPWEGYIYPTYPLIASKAKSPNAAKLFVRYLLTEEGVKPYVHDGGTPTLKTAKPGELPPGLSGLDALFRFNPASLETAFQKAQDMQDFWRNSHGG
jgi:iron(III) transport system substrate-binding protein